MKHVVKEFGSRPLLTLLTQVVVITASTLSLLVGYYSLGRIPFPAFASPAEAQLRIILISVAVIGVAFSLINRQAVQFSCDRNSLAVVATTGAIYMFCTANAFILGPSGFGKDALVTSIAILTALTLIAGFGQSSINWFVALLTVQAVGVVLLLLSLIGVQHEELYGAGWASVGSPTTFSKIEFLAACASLTAAYLPRVRQKSHWRYSEIVLAGLLMYASLRSNSIAAALGILALSTLLVYELLNRGSYRRIAFVLLATVTLFGIYLATSSEVMRAKVTDSSATACLDPGNLGCDVSNVSVPASESKPEIGSPPNSPINSIQVSDRSERIGMALTSIQDLRDRPIWGVGWGNFEHFGRLYSNADSPMVIYRHPHNIALEFAAQGGIVGAILLFVAILISSCLIRRAITRDLRLLFLSGACLFLAVGTLFAGDLFDFRLYWFAVLLVVMGSSSLPASQKRAQNSQEINRLDAAMTLDKGPIPQSDRL